MKKLLVIGLAMCGGCLGPVTVNVLSSRMVNTQASTNRVDQKIDRGATIEPSLELGDSAIQAAAEAITGQLPATANEMVRQYMLSQTNNEPRSTP